VRQNGLSYGGFEVIVQTVHPAHPKVIQFARKTPDFFDRVGREKGLPSLVQNELKKALNDLSFVNQSLYLRLACIHAPISRIPIFAERGV